MYWKVIDLSNSIDSNKFVKFLNNNYKIDKPYKINYTVSYIEWILGNNEYLILSIVDNINEEIYGCIAVCLKNITIFNTTDNFAVFPLLCVHEKYRLRNMSSVLIDEAIRRFTNSTNCDIGIFYSPICVETPVAYVSYYHRPLNFKLLIESGVMKVKEGDIKNYEKIFDNSIKEFPDFNYIPLNEKYILQIYDLYNKWNSRYNIHQNFTLDDFTKTFINKNVKTYIILNSNNIVVDFFSCFELNYKFENKIIKIAYLYTYTCFIEPIKSLFENMIKILILEKYDMFTVSDMMNISDVLFCRKTNIDTKFVKEEFEKLYMLKFIKGSDTKYLHLFNYTSPSITSEQLSLPLYI